MSSLQSLRATAHPIRLRLLSLVTSTAMSAAEAARELGLSQATASYHLRVLERAGLVTVVEVVRLRGGEAKRYRHESSAQPFDPDGRSGGGGDDGGADDVSVEDQLVYIEAQVDELRRRVQQRTTGPGVSTDAELWVSPETWRRVVHHVGQTSALLHAAAQRPRTPGTVPVSMTVSMFPMRRP
ncbi:ArsR/SmtB family transcription factor [Curtobacterium aurantiacum]|uniref:ArsR/SmtB family transcription factor n=1 Tax=Curtobacterium aurantiacum TaxID=3236919 RepID=UPI001BDE3767|nr:helix-turn-helix domain-containing protein [Curtobacterium flaccumfaciens]MBT1677664.1 winged helix-turn-helix domain-containing protein [Curtobacterium flaccumfaciens pv. flaccumfaciens]MBT1680950.1 winged helix-turn-helix domain-containing protein [Curtobacterium flaccumfaciens pv. flaccumfaciens]